MTAIAAKSASRLGDALEVGASAEIDARYDSSRTKVNPKPVGKQAMITFYAAHRARRVRIRVTQ